MKTTIVSAAFINQPHRVDEAITAVRLLASKYTTRISFITFGRDQVFGEVVSTREDMINVTDAPTRNPEGNSFPIQRIRCVTFIECDHNCTEIRELA